VGSDRARHRRPVVAYVPAEREIAQWVRDKGWAELADNPNDEYRTNIQISELNALNACLAVILFKQSRGFYRSELPMQNLLFEICDLKIVHASKSDEN
jgi:hypothetical protein